MVYTPDMSHEEMTLKQAMDFLCIKSRITMRKYANNGAIPSRRIDTPSGPWRVFKKADLIAFKAKMVKDPGLGFSYLPMESQVKRKRRKG